jgi:uncharacterized membrane protein
MWGNEEKNVATLKNFWNKKKYKMSELFFHIHLQQPGAIKVVKNIVWKKHVVNMRRMKRAWMEHFAAFYVLWWCRHENVMTTIILCICARCFSFRFKVPLSWKFNFFLLPYSFAKILVLKCSLRYVECVESELYIFLRKKMVKSQSQQQL